MIRDDIETIARLIDKNATVVELETDSPFRVFIVKTEYPGLLIGKSGRVINAIRTIARVVYNEQKLFIEVTT